MNTENVSNEKDNGVLADVLRSILQPWSGITKREYMATQIMAGFSANRWSMENGNYIFEMLSEIAVNQTDALLEALSKP